jgi:hypothetical protein
LRIHILNSLIVSVVQEYKKRLTFNPFKAVVPLEKKFSFINKSSCLISAPAKFNMM